MAFSPSVWFSHQIPMRMHHSAASRSVKKVAVAKPLQSSWKSTISRNEIHPTIGLLVVSFVSTTTSSCRKNTLHHGEQGVETQGSFRHCIVDGVHRIWIFPHPLSTSTINTVLQTDFLDVELSRRQSMEFAKCKCPKGPSALCLKSFQLRTAPEGTK